MEIENNDRRRKEGKNEGKEKKEKQLIGILLSFLGIIALGGRLLKD